MSVTKRAYNSHKRSVVMPPVYRGRRLVLMMVLLAGIVVLLGRAAYLEVFQQTWLKKQADKRQLRTVTVPPYRGMIVDRNGEALAVSSPVASVSIDPQKLLRDKAKLQKQALKGDDKAAVAQMKLVELDKNLLKMEAVLGMSEGALSKRIEKDAIKQFTYLARQIEPEKAEAIDLLNIRAVNTKREYRRFYPMAETTSHVVGFTNIDD